MRNEKFSGFDVILKLIQIITAYKKMILILTGTGTILAIAAVFLMEKTYRSSAVIKPPVNESNSLSSILGSNDLGPMAGMMNSFLSSSESGEDDCISILSSVKFSLLVIREFDLETAYKFKKRKKYYMADVIKAFNRNWGVEATEEGGLNISVEDTSADNATKMLTYMISLLDSLYVDMLKKTVQQKLSYYNTRIELAVNEMNMYEDSLAEFQAKNNLYLPEVQVEAILRLVVEMETKIELLDQELDLIAALRGKETSNYRKLSIQKNKLQRELQKKFTGPQDSSSLALPVHIVPALAIKYFRLERMLKVKSAVYKFLVQNVELLKLEEAKSIQEIVIIDPPWVNDKKVAPKRRLIVQMVFVLLFIFSCLLAVILEMWKKHKEKNSATYQMICDIRKNLLTFK